MVTIAAEVGRAGATKALDAVEDGWAGGVVVVVVVMGEEEEVAVEIKVVEVVVWEVEVVPGGRGRGSSGVVVVAEEGEAEVEEAGGEAVIWGLTITVVVELWAPVGERQELGIALNREEERWEKRTYILWCPHKRILARNILHLQHWGSFGNLQRKLGRCQSMFGHCRSTRRRLGRCPSRAGSWIRMDSSCWVD